jgi:hypothetical protein
MSNSNLFLSLGKPVKNEYGKVIGKIASYALTPSGQFDAVFIEFGDGQFCKLTMEYIKFNGAEVTYISKIKNQTNMLCDQIPLIWRKDQAIKESLDKRKIPNEMYQELHASFDGILSKLKKEAQITIDDATVEIEKCEDQLKALSYAFANLEIEHGIGQIDEDNYRASLSMLQENHRRITAEKSDIESMKSKISSTLLGETITPSQPVMQKSTKVYAEQVGTSKSELPEPPVVVYVKDIGKSM